MCSSCSIFCNGLPPPDCHIINFLLSFLYANSSYFSLLCLVCIPIFLLSFSMHCLTIGPSLCTENYYYDTLDDMSVSVCCFVLNVEFLLKTDSGYPRDAEVTSFTLANPEHSLRFNTHWSAPPVSALARSGGPRKMS